MSKILDRIRNLVLSGSVKVSSHGYDELANDGILARDAVKGIQNALLIEEYLDYPKGPCVLMRQRDPNLNPIHVVWGIPKGKDSPAVLVTAHRPDPTRWSADFLRRKP